MNQPNEKLNLPARMTRYFLHNPAVSIIFLIAVLLSGIASFVVNPKAKDPEINIPKFQVTLDYPGATADEVEEFVTKEIEELLADLEGVKEINSVSLEGGKAIITVEFETYIDIDDAKIRVLSKLNEKESVIQKAGLSSPVIKDLDSDALPILEIAFISDVYTQNQTRALVVDILSELRKVPGVNNLQVRGGDKRTLNIILDPGKMQVLDISAIDITRAIENSNIKVSNGIVRSGDKYYEIETNGTFFEKEAAEKILIKPGIQIKDIAEVQDFFPEKTSSSQLWDGEVKDAVYISLAKVEGKDAIRVSKDVIAALDEEMKKEKYKDIKYQILRNDGEKADVSAKDLVISLFTSMIAVLLTLIYFLNFRGALNVAVGIPLAIMVALTLGYLNEVILSEVAFYGLILALGLFVDSTTVVVDGAYNYIRQGIDNKEAFIRTINETGSGLIISNLMTIIVFIPVAMISGTVGQYIYPAVFYILMAIIGSVVMAVSLVPFIGNMLLKRESKERKKDFIDKLGDRYVAVLEKILLSRRKQKVFAIGVFIAFVIALLFPILGLVKEKSLTGGDTDEFSIYIDGPEGMDVIRTQQITDNVVEMIRGREGIKAIQVFTAEPMTPDMSSSARGSETRDTPNVSTVKIKLEEEMAADDFEDYVNQVRDIISQNEQVKEIMEKENVKIKVLADTPIPVFANVELKVKGPDREIREKVADDLVSMLGKIEGVIYIDTSIEDTFPKIVYRIDHDKALDSGVTANGASDALQAALGPLVVSQFHVPEINESATIQLQFARSDRDQLSDLSQIFLTNIEGESVPLDSVVEKKETRNESKRIMDSRQPTTKVTSEVEGVPSIDVTNEIAERIENEYVFPEEGKLINVAREGFTFALPNSGIYSIEWGGELKESNESNADLQVAMIIAFSAIIIIFILQFGSFKIPMIVVSSIPLSLIGFLPAFAILYLLIDLYYTSMATLGVITLMGIVVNNSILLIEYYDIAREKGVKFVEAFLESGRKRFRPIMLTTVTTILGNLVMIFDPTWNSLAWTIIFGLSVSTGLVIFLVPILYSLFINKEEQTVANK